MSELSREFLANLVAAPVARSVIADALGTRGSVSMALSRYARGMMPPHVVERHGSGDDLKYILRPVGSGELPGQIKEALPYNS